MSELKDQKKIAVNYIPLTDLFKSEIVKEFQKTEKNVDLLELLVNVFGRVYVGTKWHKIAKGKEIAPNIFEHRLCYACKSDKITTCLESLCSRLSVQASLVDPELLMRIKAIPDHMAYVREQTRFITALAQAFSKKWKELRYGTEPENE
jgi:hypothetical protein